MFTIRPFEKNDRDYEALVAILNAAWPDRPTTVDAIRYHDDNENENYLFYRVLVENADQQIVAEGDVWEDNWTYIPGKYSLNFTILPDWENKGLEERIYTYLIDYLDQRDPKDVAGVGGRRKCSQSLGGLCCPLSRVWSTELRSASDR